MNSTICIFVLLTVCISEMARGADLQPTPSSIDRLHRHITLATTYMEAGEYRNAERELHEAEKLQNDAHNEVSRAQVLNGWGGVYLLQRRLVEAEVSLRHALQILIYDSGDADTLAAVLENLAGVEIRTGKYAEALDHQQEALHLWHGILRPDDPTLMRAYGMLSTAEYLNGHPDRALASIDRAIRVGRTAYGPTHIFVAALLESEAMIFDRLRRKKDAKIARREARAIRAGDVSAAVGSYVMSVRERRQENIDLVTK